MEKTLIFDFLKRVKAGSGGVLLIEGEAGIGKSALLAEAASVARARSFSAVSAEAHELERGIPLCPLLVAFSDAVAWLAGIQADDVGSQVRAIIMIRDHILDLAAANPVLVTVDNVEFAEPATLLALRLLTRRLSGQRIGWILARSQERGTSAEALFRLLGKDGATVVPLGAIPDDAVAGLAADLTGGQPDESLLTILGRVSGNPKLIHELIAGLRDEQLLRTSGGRATLVADHIPRRLHSVIRDQMSGLGQPARQLLDTAALLGRSFAVADVAEMLGQTSAAIMPTLNEAIASGILVAEGDLLSFRDPITWEAINVAIPEPLARALHQQFAEILLKRGSTLQAAGYLLKGAWRGDRRELDMLSGAATDLMQAAPRAASDLALRAQELTQSEDSAWLRRSLTATRSLVAARRLDLALSVANAALSTPMTIAEQAELRCAVAAIYSLSGQPDEARAEAQWVLAREDVREDTREDASALFLRTLAALPDSQEAENAARTALIAHRGATVRETTIAVGVLALLRWRGGRVADGLRLFRDAAFGQQAGGSGGLNPFVGRLDLAARLIDIRELGEARSLAEMPVEESVMVAAVESQVRAALLRGRIHLVEGNLDAAADEALAVLSGGPDTDRCFYNQLAKCLLAKISLRRGDQSKAQKWLDQLPAEEPGSYLCPVSVQRSMMTTELAATGEAPESVLKPVTWLYDCIGQLAWLLISEPAAAPWLVRLALAAGDWKRASLVVAEAEKLSRVNHRFPSVVASGKHAAGLMHRETRLLMAALATQPDGWERASAAEDLGMLLAATKGDDAIAFLDQAHDGFSSVGAVRDAARVRRRLRGLGVARRSRSAARERSAGRWGSLTEIEAGIAELAAGGLTNRQIGEQSFISEHTVAFHLRRIFRKLGITSRVELARQVPATREDVSQ